MKDFEKAFENIIESDEYETVCDSVFNLTRTAFIAGFKFAGGKIPDNYKIIDFKLRKEKK